MSEIVFGIDFGTTNSLVSYVVGSRVTSCVDQEGKPHPSAIWFIGDEVKVGRIARMNMEDEGSETPSDVIRSPKMTLFKENFYVQGEKKQPVEAVEAVLNFLKGMAKEGPYEQEVKRAVMTIPVAFNGMQRRILRDAASRSGISVVQFVHEPVAALYGYLRSRDNLERELMKLENGYALVFDWGGGTLDLTLCKIQGRKIMQLANLGDSEVGGDNFDARLRNLVREKHAKSNNITNIQDLEEPNMDARLLYQCELAKIRLTDNSSEEEPVFVRNYLNIDDPTARNMRTTISKEDLENTCRPFLERGLGRIDELLERANLTYRDIDLCLPTGGMVNLQKIKDGLIERFVGRVSIVDNGDRIISEGAAWIANDEVELKLSKPIEILIADTSGYGTYQTLVDTDLTLPIENNVAPITKSNLFCTDPREGYALIELCCPVQLDANSPRDPRKTLCSARVSVKKDAKPLTERIECLLQIDSDSVVNLTLRSTGWPADEVQREFYDLEFCLSLPTTDHDNEKNTFEQSTENTSTISEPNFPPNTQTNLISRPNIIYMEAKEEFANSRDNRRKIPGDIVERYEAYHFSSNQASNRQIDERNFYVRCGKCGKTPTQIFSQGHANDCWYFGQKF